MVFDFLEPIDVDFLEFISELPAQSLGRKVIFHTSEVFPDLEKTSIAIVGVLENRGMDERKDHVTLDYIRF